MSDCIKALYDDLVRRAPSDPLVIRIERYVVIQPDWTEEEEAAWKEAARAFAEPIPFVKHKPETWRDRPPLL